MPTNPHTQPDQAKIVASLAAKCHVPVGEMAQLYEHERGLLARTARMTQFLHIFATRKVLERLRSGPQGQPSWP
jgi:hypothetical protein